MPPRTVSIRTNSRGLIFCLASLLIIVFSPFSHADELADLTTKAQRGDAESQFELAQRYAEGKGVDKDEAHALAWFKKAADQDLGKAEVSLGSIYAHGFGVKQDWAESIRWYRKAALQGDPVALHNLGLDFNYGHGVGRDYEQAANYFRLGAEQGQPRCQYNLGLLYEEGHGVDQSPSEACLYYTLASAHENQIHIFGEAKAKEVAERRDRLSKNLSPAQLELIQRNVKAYQARVA